MQMSDISVLHIQYDYVMCGCTESPHVIVGVGVPVASQSSSRILLRMTVASVVSLAPSTTGGTKYTHTKIIVKHYSISGIVNQTCL